ncbi:unnamed protein product, partial [Sphacelaria rigidula]
ACYSYYLGICLHHINRYRATPAFCRADLRIRSSSACRGTTVVCFVKDLFARHLSRMRVSPALMLVWWSTHHYITNGLLAATPKMSLRMVTQPNINHHRSLRQHNKKNKWTSSVWDGHLELAIAAHQTKCWSVVRLLCRRVISRADDWSAVEQAYLRLALAEQKGEGVNTARRVFQEGTAACSSSD